jgi:hypothetical protein
VGSNAEQFDQDTEEASREEADEGGREEEAAYIEERAQGAVVAFT